VALAMTVATLGLFVFAPALMESDGESPHTQMVMATSPSVNDAAIVL
jgi:hypothetical protein